MNRKPEHIDSIVGDILREIENRKIKRANAVGEAWRKAVNEKICEHAQPVSMKKGVMMIITENSNWLYEITMQKREIIKKFNETYTGRQKLKEIRVRVGEIT
ncbi:MAG: DUF721 domain-containing protein [Candidatus Omnitrophica bacterium]|nr:DUF721 domain-containing protein [Candidatus Omnitrophota bacterium]